jgi:LuxR family maltose regulon positive regulatory protein
MATTPLLATKTYTPPTRPDLVSRPRLIERLNAGILGQSGDQGRLAFARKLTLVSAPAGFGKTTLLSEWASDPSSPTQVAWLSLDEGDNDPSRFWRYVIAALQTANAPLGETVRAAPELPQRPPLETLVMALINDLTLLPTALTLVLDDYHVIDSQPIHDSLNLFIDRIPQQVRMIVTTRADPPLFLSRRRARSELTEIRTADLCFTTEEATEFLNACMDLELPAEDIAALENRTESWIVGLHLAALSLQGRTKKHEFVTAFAGDDRYIGDYLVDEVLQHQSPRIRRFLLQTSILERLCGPLCDAVTGEPGNQALLDHLERANVFTVPLDDRRYWYRYHHLFADLLRRHLRHSTEARELGLLHLRASTWYERQGFIAEAVSHALAMPDLGHATTLIERHAPDVASRGEVGLAQSWLEALPEDLIRSSPFLCILSSAQQESVGLAEQWLQRAERAWAALPGHADGQTRSSSVAQLRFSGWMASARASLSFRRGDPPREVVHFSRQALDSIPEDDLLYNWRARSNLFLVLGCAYWHLEDEESADHAFGEARRIGDAVEHFSASISATRNQARIAYNRGQLRRAAAICQQALQTIVEPSEQAGRPLPVAGGLYIVLGSVLREWNDLKDADRALTKGVDLAKLTRETAIQRDGTIALARLKQAQGDMEKAFDLIEQSEQLKVDRDPQAAPLRGWFWLSQAEHDPRDLASASRLAAEARSEAAALRIQLWLSQAEQDPHYLTVAGGYAEERHIKLDDREQRRPEQLAMARLQIAQYRTYQRAPSVPPAPDQIALQSLLQFLDRQLQLAEKRGQIWWTIETLILRALALQARDEIDRAMSSLGRALTLAEPGGYVRAFVDEGAPMARLLYQAAASGIASGYTGKLLAAFGAETRDKREKTRAETISLAPRPISSIEPLTRRELEVLHLIAAGLSNREIAQRLVISPGTVKAHASNIYDKLGVRKRTQAVAKARMLGILPSA